MRTQEQKADEQWDDLFTMVDEPIWALEQFLELMEEQATRTHGEDLEKQVYIAQTLLKDAVAKIESRTKQIEAKLGARVQLACSGTEITKAKVIPLRRERRGVPEGFEILLDIDVPDFRTVELETEQDDELQRTFEVMRRGGKDWMILKKAIALAWDSYMRQECEFAKKMMAIFEKNRADKAEEPEQVSAEEQRKTLDAGEDNFPNLPAGFGPGPEGDEIADFRSVKPGSEEEIQLQRFYRCMRRNNDTFGIISRMLLVDSEEEDEQQVTNLSRH